MGSLDRNSQNPFGGGEAGVKVALLTKAAALVFAPAYGYQDLPLQAGTF